MKATHLKINNLFGGYDKAPILKDITLDIQRGDFIGIIGPNGSGKTTLLRLISRVLFPQSGEVKLNGSDIYKMNSKEFCRKVSFVPQDTAIYFPFSVFEIVLMGRIPHLKRMQFESNADTAIAEEALKMTGSFELKNKKIDQLSAGERQRVIVARSLAQQPELLFLDEPTSHLDIGHQIQILDLLKKLNKNNQMTIAMVLHDLNLASEYCNRIVLLDQGSIYKEGVPEEVLTYQNIEAVYKTVVVVKRNSISSKPYVLLVSGENK